MIGHLHVVASPSPLIHVLLGSFKGFQCLTTYQDAVIVIKINSPVVDGFNHRERFPDEVPSPVIRCAAGLFSTWFSDRFESPLCAEVQALRLPSHSWMAGDYLLMRGAIH